MTARIWLPATVLAIAATAVAPAFVDAAGATTVTAAASTTHVVANDGPTLGIGTALTLHKVGNKVVKVQPRHHRHHHHH